MEIGKTQLKFTNMSPAEIAYRHDDDFLYKDFESLIASYYLTYLEFEKSPDKEKVKKFKELEDALNRLADLYHVQKPKEAIKFVLRSEPEITSSEIGEINDEANFSEIAPFQFENYEFVKESLKSFLVDFQLRTGSEGSREIHEIIKIISSPIFAF